MDDNVERISISLHMCVCVVGYALELFDKRLIFASSVHCILEWTLLPYSASERCKQRRLRSSFLGKSITFTWHFPQYS